MKTTLFLVLCAAAAGVLVSCGGTKKNVATATPTHQEFDPSTGAWKPLSKKVAPPPHERGAVIVEEKKPGVIDKVGKTLKKPLEWVGLGKDETPPAAATPAASAPAKKSATAQ